jgi:hypothetical protein
MDESLQVNQYDDQLYDELEACRRQISALEAEVARLRELIELALEYGISSRNYDAKCAIATADAMRAALAAKE